MDAPTPVAGGMPYGHLEDLLRKNLEVAEANHKILKRMERNAIIGFFAKIVIWLIVLGVPIFFLSSYIAPIMAFVTGSSGGATVPSGLFGLPSADQIRHVLETYKPKQ